MEGAGPSSRSSNWNGKDGIPNYLEFLYDDVHFGGDSLDPATLAAVCSVDPTALSRASLSPGTTKPCKEGDGPCGLAARPLAGDESSDEDSSDDDKDIDVGHEEKGQRKKRKKEVSVAAKNKACREKARREKMNERFLELAKLLEPGKEPKTDKSSILSDALKSVQQLRVENHQLRQLNKFLEERVGQYEKERGQQLYQQSLAIQSSLVHGQVPQPHAHPHLQPQAQLLNGLTSAAALQHGAAGLGQGCVTGVPCGPGTLAALTNPLTMANAAFAGSSAAALQPQSQHLLPASAASLQASLNAAHKPLLLQQLQGAPPLHNPYWVSAAMLDSTQDSLLRPPAA